MGGKMLFNCNLYGHLSINCDKPGPERKCYICSDTRHVSRQCPKRRNNTNSNVMNIENGEEDTISKFTNKVIINSIIQAICLIYNGAVVCTIKKSLVETYELPIQTRKNEISLTGFGGFENTVKVTEETNFILKIHGVEEIVTAAVELGNAQASNIILGRIFTEMPEIAYVRKGNLFKFTKHLSRK